MDEETKSVLKDIAPETKVEISRYPNNKVEMDAETKSLLKDIAPAMEVEISSIPDKIELMTMCNIGAAISLVIRAEHFELDKTDDIMKLKSIIGDVLKGFVIPGDEKLVDDDAKRDKILIEAFTVAEGYSRKLIECTTGDGVKIVDRFKKEHYKTPDYFEEIHVEGACDILCDAISIGRLLSSMPEKVRINMISDIGMAISMVMDAEGANCDDLEEIIQLKSALDKVLANFNIPDDETLLDEFAVQNKMYIECYKVARKENVTLNDYMAEKEVRNFRAIKYDEFCHEQETRGTKKLIRFVGNSILALLHWDLF